MLLFNNVPTSSPASRRMTSGDGGIKAGGAGKEPHVCVAIAPLKTPVNVAREQVGYQAVSKKPMSQKGHRQETKSLIESELRCSEG